MEVRVVMLAAVPVRREPAEASEMTNQLLFGESAGVLGRERYFLKIRSLHDGYEGWVDERQLSAAQESDGSDGGSWVLGDAAAVAREVGGAEKSVWLVRGARLPNYDGESFTLAGRRFALAGSGVRVGARSPADVALDYLDCPYHWGGRSPFGIDCSGLVQMCFGIAGFPLPRDSSQQKLLGAPVSEPDDIAPGDLIACEAAAGGSHIGIALSDGRVIHACARVRIDPLDPARGIVSADSGDLTHKLHSVRRI